MLSIFGLLFAAMFGRMVQSVYQDIRENSPSAKTKFQSEFPGLDAMPSRYPLKRRHAISMANGKFCPCRCGYTIAACLQEDRNCFMRTNNIEWVQAIIRKAR